MTWLMHTCISALSLVPMVFQHFIPKELIYEIILLTRTTLSLVPRPILTFSMLHAEKVGIGLGTRLRDTHAVIPKFNVHSMNTIAW